MTKTLETVLLGASVVAMGAATGGVFHAAMVDAATGQHPLGIEHYAGIGATVGYVAQFTSAWAAGELTKLSTPEMKKLIASAQMPIVPLMTALCYVFGYDQGLLRY